MDGQHRGQAHAIKRPADSIFPAPHRAQAESTVAIGE